MKCTIMCAAQTAGVVAEHTSLRMFAWRVHIFVVAVRERSSDSLRCFMRRLGIGESSGQCFGLLDVDSCMRRRRRLLLRRCLLPLPPQARFKLLLGLMCPLQRFVAFTK